MILHCFSMPDRLEECLAHGWWISFAGNVTYPKAERPRRGRRARPAERLLVETDAPYLTPQAVRKERNQPAYVAHTARFVAERRGVAYEELERRVDAQRRRAVRLVTGELPTQPSLRRMRQFGVRPNRELGQNFLVDSQHPRRHRARRRAGRDDVVLEIGGGLGVLASTWRRAPRTCTSSSSTARWSRRCATRSAPHPNTTLHVADAVELDLARAAPGADEGRREPALRHRRDRDPAHDRGAADASRAGWRWSSARSASASPPRRARAAYGVPSVLAQLACDVRVLRPISRTVFHPVPNVDSVLVVLDRTGPARRPALRALVRAAFAHRRKALARSLALAPGAAPDVRDRARAALAGARPSRRRARRAPVAG